MKKIDILNFITSGRKEPNAIKSYKDIAAHFGVSDGSQLNSLLQELMQTKVLKEHNQNGEKSYQVVTR